MFIRKEEIDRIKQTDLPQLIQSKGINLIGNNGSYKALCPFHNDTNPSLNLSRKGNIWVWHCFACNIGGSVIDFVMKIEGIEFKEAVERLKSNGSTQIEPVTKKEERTPILKKLLSRVVEFYHKVFFSDRRGLEYMVNERKIKNNTIFRDFKIGFCNGSIYDVIPEDNGVITGLKELGILNSNGKELFTNCVVFPITDEKKEIVNLYGRSINGSGHLYLPGPLRGVFNWQCLKHYPEIYITESIIDCLSLYQEGIRNVIPIYGVNGFTRDHEQLLRKYSTKEIYLLLDGDSAGRNASIKLKERLNPTLCHILNLPEGEDPSSYLKNHTREDIEALLPRHTETKSTTDIILLEDGFQVKYGERLYQVRGIEGSQGNRLKANIRVIHRNRFFIDTIDLYNARLRRGFITEASKLYKEEQEIIENDIDRIIESSEKYIVSKLNEKEDKAIIISEKDREIATRFGRSPNLINLILKDFEKIGIVGEEINKLIGYIAMTSRKMEDPLSLLIISGSGSGKSLLQDGILSLCPEEDLIKLTAVTEKALFYKKETSLMHKVIAIEEDKGAYDANYAIRNLISSKLLMIEATIKDPLTGKMTTMTNKVKGPANVFKTTTDPHTDPETRSRFIITSVDESQEQTRRILELQRQSRTLEGLIKKREREEIIQKHHNFQRLLRPLTVINPFSPLLTYLDDRMVVRRENPKYLQLIDAVAFLHQMSRPIKEIEVPVRANGLQGQSTSNGAGIPYIEVTLEDIQTANHIANEIFGRSLDELTQPSRRLLMIIDEMVTKQTREKGCQRQEISFSRREIREYSKWSDYQIKTHIRELVDKEYLIVEYGRQGKLYTYRLIYNSQGQDGTRFVLGLINIEELRKKAIKLGILPNLEGNLGHLEG